MVKSVKRREARKRYRNSQNGRLQKRVELKRYFKTENGKAVLRTALKKYKKSEKGKFKVKMYKKGLHKTTPHDKILTLEQWKLAKAYFFNQCAYCGEYKERLTQDHIVPIKLNGEYSKNNIIPACRSCNAKKSNYNMVEWFSEQPFFSTSRLKRINPWMKGEIVEAQSTLF